MNSLFLFYYNIYDSCIYNVDTGAEQGITKYLVFVYKLYGFILKCPESILLFHFTNSK